MATSVLEISIHAEHCELVTQAQLNQQRVDGSNLNTLVAAPVANVGGTHMIITIWDYHRQGAKALEDCGFRSRSAEALEQLLQYEAGSEDEFL